MENQKEKKTLTQMEEYEIFRYRENGSIYMIISFSQDGVKVYNFKTKNYKYDSYKTEVFPFY